MDWTDTATVVQAIYWTVLFGLWAMGYHHGNKAI